jgi:hypothetical protein
MTNEWCKVTARMEEQFEEHIKGAIDGRASTWMIRAVSMNPK